MRPHGNRMPPPCQRGAVAAMTPFLLIFMLAFAALAIDVARLLIVRNQLQNAADAAALVGAGGLYPANPKPNWSNGVTQGTSAITLNATEGVKLISGQVQAGYWDLSRTKSGLQPQDITPGTNDAAAVQVTVSRSDGNNNGPVSMLLAPVFGVLSEPVQATAVAVIAAPGRVGPGALLPVAINQCLYDKFWDSTTGQPKINPSTGKSYVFDIYSDYINVASYPSPMDPCWKGQWTSLTPNDPGSQSAKLIKDMVTGANPTPPVALNDPIFIQSGAEASIYDAVQSQLSAALKSGLSGWTVTVPVVSSVSTNSDQPVVAFASLLITSVTKQGNKSYIEGSFVPNAKISGSTGGVGPYYGAYVPPRLAW
ncbi:TadG family pilus assembly protein [Cupriavidus basilensis]|nr:TadG family pilus assembly protein [Cupriavidus basilensis]MDF3883910.1 TadG family pilus assembly protein [Cupriavidus basilensis]